MFDRLFWLFYGLKIVILRRNRNQEVMSNPFFQFKHFTVFHDRCAMKVGTDAVLLGTWVRVDGASRLLDIGAGCGVISLMVAQRCDGHVFAVEVDSDAALQAVGNVSRSPWSERVVVINQDIRSFECEEKFDVIFSNPPYFVNSLKSPDKIRSSARHTDEGLGFEELFDSVCRLLTREGEFSLVIPTDIVPLIKSIAISHLLYLSRETHVKTKEGKKPKRSLLAFRFICPEEPVGIKQLPLLDESGRPSQEYALMVKDFYL